MAMREDFGTNVCAKKKGGGSGDNFGSFFLSFFLFSFFLSHNTFVSARCLEFES